MADAKLITFKLTDGPYAGDYAVDPEDFTASEMGEFRKALGFPLESIGATNMGIDVLAGLVWLTLRRRTKGLAYGAVADSFTSKTLEVVTESEVDDPPA